MDGCLSYWPFFCAVYKVKSSSTLLLGIGFIFIPKESVSHGDRSCRKSSISSCLWLTQYCVSTPRYCCPELFSSLTRVLFSFTHQCIMFYSAVLKSTSLTHFNKSFKSLCENEKCSSFVPHQHLCHLKCVILTSAFLIERLPNLCF